MTCLMGLRGTCVRLAAVFLAALGIVSTALPAAADDISDAQARLQAISRIKGALQDNLQKAEAQEIALEQQLQETQDQINQTIQQITEKEREIAELERKIAALEAKIAETRLALQRAKQQYGNFIRTTYKSDTDPFAELLGAPNFQAFLNRAVAIEHLSFLSGQLWNQIEATERDLHLQEDAVKEAKAQTEKDRADLVDQKKALDKQQAHERDLQAQLRTSIA